MHKRNNETQLNDKRMFDVYEGAQYTGMGVNSFKKWSESIGAVRRFGRSVRFDCRVIDGALDNMGDMKK